MYAIEFFVNAVKSKKFKSILVIVASFFISTAIFGGMWYLFSKDFYCILKTIGIQIALFFIFSSPLGEKLAIYFIYGKNMVQTQQNVVNSFYSVFDDMKNYYPDLLKRVTLHVSHNDSSASFIVIGKHKIVVDSGIRNLEGDALNGTFFWALLSCVYGGGLGPVVCLAANSIIILTLILWDKWNVLLAKVLSHTMLGSLPARAHEFDVKLVNMTYVRLFCFFVRNSAVEFVKDVNDFSDEMVEKYGPAFDKITEMVDNLS